MLLKLGHDALGAVLLRCDNYEFTHSAPTFLACLSP